MQNEDLIKGAALGVGLALLVPVAIMALAPVVKPLARSAVRGGLLAYEKGREALEEIGESMEDLKAEIEAEMSQARNVGDETAADADAKSGD
jgi:hypothetical protein